MLNRDVALYALGIGACASDAVDADELKYVYHENGQQFIKVLFILVILVKVCQDIVIFKVFLIND